MLTSLHVARPRLLGMGVVAAALVALLVSELTLGADSARPSLRLKAWAVLVKGNTLHALLIDKSTHAAQVSLQIPSAGPVTAQRLLARSARAASGITLGGQHLNAGGHWVGKPTSEIVHRSTDGYQVTVRGISATLVTATLNPGALTATHHR